MKKILLLVLISIFTGLLYTKCTRPQNKVQKPKILIITGGHSFDTSEFFNVFDSMTNYDFSRAVQPEANELLGSPGIGNYNLIIFYDMWGQISENQKQYYQNLTEKGVGLLFLHHSLVSYQGWDEFRKILGGKYIQPEIVTDSTLLSRYKHDILLDVHIVDPKHPVTSGMKDFEIPDEGYSNFAVEKNVFPLLTSKHPDSGEIIGWTNKYKNSQIVYLMLGHDKKAYANENFRKLIDNSIKYLTEN
jgi:uncharacterized protein